MSTHPGIGRSELLRRSGPIANGLILSPTSPASDLPADKRLQTCAVISAFTCRRHSQALLGDLAESYRFHRKLTSPGMNAVGMHVPQQKCIKM